jgi:hypothetical protein
MSIKARYSIFAHSRAIALQGSHRQTAQILYPAITELGMFTYINKGLLRYARNDILKSVHGTGGGSMKNIDKDVELASFGS